MKRETRALPQASGRLFLTDAGLHSDAELRGDVAAESFAPHTLLAHSAGRYALARYFRSYLSVARRFEAAFVLDTPTARAHLRWAGTFGATEMELRKTNRDAVDFVADLRDEFAGSNASDEAVGLVNAAKKAELPIALSFCIGADALLTTGRRLCDVIAEIDQATSFAPAYYAVECAHPDHLRIVLGHADALRRIKGLRCTAWPHAAPIRGGADRFAARNPQLLLELYAQVTTTMPWVNVVGGRF
jgi:homocysteine S-methyltransferase